MLLLTYDLFLHPSSDSRVIRDAAGVLQIAVNKSHEKNEN